MRATSPPTTKAPVQMDATRLERVASTLTASMTSGEKTPGACSEPETMSVKLICFVD